MVLTHSHTRHVCPNQPIWVSRNTSLAMQGRRRQFSRKIPKRVSSNIAVFMVIIACTYCEIFVVETGYLLNWRVGQTLLAFLMEIETLRQNYVTIILSLNLGSWLSS